MIQKNVVPLHPQLRNNMLEIAMILGYGVMVTLQILVLSFLVRVRVSQLESIFHSKDAFFYTPKAFLNMSPHFARYQKEKPRAFALGL